MFSLRILLLKQHLSSNYSICSFRLAHDLAIKEEKACTYPPIIDQSFEGRRKHRRQLWYDSIKALPTVEEKFFEIAEQSRPKLKKFVMSAVPNSYIASNFQPYITRTHIIYDMPDIISNMNVDDELNEIKETFCEEILKYYTANDLSKSLSEQDAGSELVKNLISQCYKKMALKNSHIFNSTIQTKPTIKSFWWHGGYHCPKGRLYNENICYIFGDHPAFVIRIREPLSPVLPLTDPLCATAEVPQYGYHPKVVGMGFKRDIGLKSIPGFWPGDPCEFPLLLVYPYNRVDSFLERIDKYDLDKIENSFGITASFGWLNAIANCQGFTPFHDVTYPFVTHTILTNGRDWRFFMYQLNTIAFHNDVDQKDRRNILWTSKAMRLFDTMEDGQIKGINEEVFKLLLKFLLNAPDKEAFKNINLKPYLGEDVRTLDEKFYMKYFFRQLYSGCPDAQAHKEEIPHWRRIYTMHKDAPPTPFLRKH